MRRLLLRQKAIVEGGLSLGLYASSLVDDLQTGPKEGRSDAGLLLDLLTPRGRPRHSKYVLDVRLKETIARLGVEKSELATRANLRITAKIVLQSPSGTLLFKGQSVTISSFNILGSDDLATLVAEKDARARAVRQIAGDIRTRLAAFFIQRRSPQKKAAR